MRNKLLSKITGNWMLKLMALLIAFLIWLLVTNSQNPISTELYSNVPITIVNQDSIADIGKVVEAAGSGTVTVRVTERRSIRDRLRTSDFYVEADLENINEMNTVPLTVTCSNPAVSWDEIQILPSSLKVTLEDKVEQQFAISVAASGDEASGYEVGATEIAQGKNIYIAGPRSLIQIIDRVVAPVAVNGLRNDTQKTVTLEVYDKNGEALNENQLRTLEFKDSSGAAITDRKVQLNLKLWKVQSDVAIEVETTGTPAFGYRIAAIHTIPAAISLAGTDEALEALGGRLTLADPISVAGLKENLSLEVDLTTTVAPIQGLKLVDGSDPVITVEVQIEKNGDQTVSVPLVDVELQNRPANMGLVFTPAEKISIPVHSLDGDGAPISPQDVKVSADLAPCAEEGNHEIAVKVELPEGYELASPVTLVVTSTREAPSAEIMTAG